MSATLQDIPPADYWSHERITGFVCALCFLLAAGSNIQASVISRIDEVKSSDSFRKRTVFCVALQLNMFFISSLCSLLSLSDIDDVYVSWKPHKVDVAKYGDWLVTCPMLQLIIVVFAGPDTDIDYVRHIGCTALVIVCGTLATFLPVPALRGTLFAFGCALFLNILYTMDKIILQVSQAHASMTRGGHALRVLCLITAFTWLSFPALWLCSTDGFSLMPDLAMAFPIINVVSKVGFMFAFRVCLTQLVQEVAGEKDMTIANVLRRPSLDSLGTVDDLKRRNSATDFQVSTPRRESGTPRRESSTPRRESATRVTIDLEAAKPAPGSDGGSESTAPTAPGQGAPCGAPCSDDLQGLLMRAMHASGGAQSEQELQRVLGVLSREWVLTVPTLLDLRPEDLHRLGVPVGLVSAVRVELVRRQHPTQVAPIASGQQPDGSYSFWGCASSSNEH